MIRDECRGLYVLVFSLFRCNWYRDTATTWLHSDTRGGWYCGIALDFGINPLSLSSFLTRERERRTESKNGLRCLMKRLMKSSLLNVSKRNCNKVSIRDKYWPLQCHNRYFLNYDSASWFHWTENMSLLPQNVFTSFLQPSPQLFPTSWPARVESLHHWPQSPASPLVTAASDSVHIVVPVSRNLMNHSPNSSLWHGALQTLIACNHVHVLQKKKQIKLADLHPWNPINCENNTNQWWWQWYY